MGIAISAIVYAVYALDWDSRPSEKNNETEFCRFLCPSHWRWTEITEYYISKSVETSSVIINELSSKGYPFINTMKMSLLVRNICTFTNNT